MLRERWSLTAVELAGLMGVSVGAVQSMVSRVTEPSEDTVIRFRVVEARMMQGAAADTCTLDAVPGSDGERDGIDEPW